MFSPGFYQDLRYASRFLAKSPGFTVIVVIALAIGIGANTAIFSIVNSVLLHPLPFPKLDRMAVILWSDKRQPSGVEDLTAVADYLEWRQYSKTLEHIASFRPDTYTVEGNRNPLAVQGLSVSGSFFDVFDIKPVIGRTFSEGEYEFGHERVVVLSYGIWVQGFGADPNILSKNIQIAGVNFQVIGVMPREFRFLPDSDLWTPLVLAPGERHDRANRTIQVVARLRPGISLTKANAEFDGFSHQLESAYPLSHSGRAARVALLRERFSGKDVIAYVIMLIGSVSLLLLISCANVANMQFAHWSLRSGEIAMRAMLGANRWRLAQQMLIESMLLSLLAGAAGLAGAWISVNLLGSLIPPSLARSFPNLDRFVLNGTVLFYVIAASLLAGLLAGIAPAIFGSWTNLSRGLQETNRNISVGRPKLYVTNVLVVAQVTLALTLLVLLGQLVNGMRRVTEPLPNTAPRAALTMRVSLPETKYQSKLQIAAFQVQMLQMLKTISDVEFVALASNLPYSGTSKGGAFKIDGYPLPPGSLPPRAQFQSVSADYFRAMHIPIRNGRSFDHGDGPDAVPVVIVSEKLAHSYFPGRDPIGKRVALFAKKDLWMTVVGVAGDLRHNPMDAAPRETLYFPFQQYPDRFFDLILRTKADPLKSITEALAKINTIDSRQPVTAVRTLQQLYDEQLAGMQYIVTIMGVFGILALVLAATGVYGILANAVVARRREIGVRMALGARKILILWMILRRGMLLTGCGLLIGFIAAKIIARLMANAIFGVQPNDTMTFITPMIGIAMAAIAACYYPARRATSIDPMRVLRDE